MQNDEDYNSPMVKQRLGQQFMQLMQEPKLHGYSKVKSLLQLAETNVIDFKHLMFVNLMLPFINGEGLRFLEANFNQFC
jgi:hypothetical protein